MPNSQMSFLGGGVRCEGKDRLRPRANEGRGGGFAHLNAIYEQVVTHLRNVFKANEDFVAFVCRGNGDDLMGPCGVRA
jgi:hypothetical protein